MSWHAISASDVAESLSVDINNGLSSQEAGHRLLKDGPNELVQGSRRTIWHSIKDQITDVMILVLIGAAGLSLWLGEAVDAGIILLIVVLNAVMGIVQESKAEKSLAALKKLASPSARVIRDGQTMTIPSNSLVRGDVLLLETGDLLPADIRLHEAVNLKIQESAITGESVPVEKVAETELDDGLALGDRVNMAYSSSTVSYGRGKGIVVATGMATEVGRIAKMLQNQDNVQTPLQIKLASLGKVLAASALALCAVILVTGLLYGREFMEMLMIAITLAVAAIPEGLPAIATIVLAMGVQRMVLRNSIVRTLPAVESLGSTSVICSDKTGTLTQNRMTVLKAYYGGRLYSVEELEGRPIDFAGELDELARIAVLCNDARLTSAGSSVGDPTETALVDLALKIAFDKNAAERLYPREEEIPFDSDRKLMSTLHRVDGKRVIHTKGGVDELLARCCSIQIDGAIHVLTDERIEEIGKVNDELARSAMRVLAFGFRELESDEAALVESDMTFVGLLGMIDPPRPEARDAVTKCKTAGMKPVMITGDHITTAVAIASELGILTDPKEAILGKALDDVTDDELARTVQNYAVYARVAPEHKVRIVKAWQAQGHVVAMTGDGVNDAPALKAADIGVAMGITGTDVSKEASDMILTDDNFATIVTAVEEGRRILDNILRTVQYLLACNIGEILLLLVATVLNLGTPLLPVHILWVNLVTDSFPALALGVEPAEPDIMQRQARGNSRSILSRGLMWRVLYQGVMVGGLTLAAFVIGARTNESTGQTMALATLACSQLVHSFNARSAKTSLFRMGLLGNRPLLAAFGGSGALMLTLLNVPFLQAFFKLEPLGTTQWLIVAMLSVAPLFVVELVKLAGLNGLREK